MNKNESKYFYTASLMNQALLELLEKKDIDFITVTEITKKAGVNRSTFYLHYDDVYELLEETVEKIHEDFISSFAKGFPTKISSKNEAFLLTDAKLTAYLNFCKKNRKIMKLIHKRPHLFQKESTYRKMYESTFYPAISQFITDETQKLYYLEFFTQGVVAIIHKWIDLDCVTEIDKVIEIIKGCVKNPLTQSL